MTIYMQQEGAPGPSWHQPDWEDQFRGYEGCLVSPDQVWDFVDGLEDDRGRSMAVERRSIIE